MKEKVFIHSIINLTKKAYMKCMLTLPQKDCIQCQKNKLLSEMQKYLTMKMTKMKTMNMENITCKAQEEWPVNTKNFCIYLRRTIFIFKNIRVVWNERWSTPDRLKSFTSCDEHRH